MPVSHAVMKQFEAELHEVDHKTRRLNGGAGSSALQSHADLAEEGGAFLHDAEELDLEDTLGCARGVVWALVLEAATVIAAAIYWKLRLTR